MLIKPVLAAVALLARRNPPDLRTEMGPMMLSQNLWHRSFTTKRVAAALAAPLRTFPSPPLRGLGISEVVVHSEICDFCTRAQR
jgi:hypothetical protein